MPQICRNRACDNRSQRFEGKYCCIACADLHDGIISLQEWLVIIEKIRNNTLNFKDKLMGY
jgi:hypothetical protein